MLILSNLNEHIMDLVDDDEELTEAKVSVMKRGLASKRSALAGATAMQIAREKNPAMYRINCMF